MADRPSELGALSGATLLITGAEGMLGRAFVEHLAGVSDARVLGLSHGVLDVTDRAAVLALASEKSDIIVHCAADVDAERCEANPEDCRRVQVGGTENVVELAARTGARLFYPQSFLIFDGAMLPITEETAPAPLSVYGRCKLEAEHLALERADGAISVRMAGFFGGDEKDKNFVGKFTRHLVALLEGGVATYGVGDRVWQPTYTMDLAYNSLLLLARGKGGIYNMSCRDEASFFDIASASVDELRIGHRIAIEPVPAAQVSSNENARRPARAVMENRRLLAEGLERQRRWREALGEYLARPYFTELFAPYATR
jgi:dTDP-4-dehydrorhamnose reductase